MQSVGNLSKKQKAKLEAAAARDAERCGMCRRSYQNGERTYVGITQGRNWYGTRIECQHKLQTIYMEGIYATDEDSVVDAIQRITSKTVFELLS